MLGLMNWINGWRVDLDGWIVRAKRQTDPAFLEPSVGFVEESCIAVRTAQQARDIDLRRAPYNIAGNLCGYCGAAAGEDCKHKYLEFGETAPCGASGGEVV